MRPASRIPSAACALPRRRCQIVAATAPRWNPQNVDNPLVSLADSQRLSSHRATVLAMQTQCHFPRRQTIPSPEVSAEETVAVQLNALQNNDEPW